MIWARDVADDSVKGLVVEKDTPGFTATKMEGKLALRIGMAVRVAQLQDDGIFRDEQSALPKSYCTSRRRETVGWARELLGGNGILMEYGVARYFNDAEALYSFEGTREISTLIVGRSITGLGAFT